MALRIECEVRFVNTRKTGPFGIVGCVERTRADAPRSCKCMVRPREYVGAPYDLGWTGLTTVFFGTIGLFLASSHFLTYVFVEQAKRSEEHTSELQSLRHLVCRLLLEK